MRRVVGQVAVQPVTVASRPRRVYSKALPSDAEMACACTPLGAAKLTASSRARAADTIRLIGIDASSSGTMCRARGAQPWRYAT